MSDQRVLVVDDNRDSAEILALLLASEGIEALMAHDGMTAIKQAASIGPM